MGAASKREDEEERKSDKLAEREHEQQLNLPRFGGHLE